MKNKLKAIAKKHFPGIVKRLRSDVVLTVDFALSQGNKVVVLGWALNQSSSIRDQSLLLNGRPGELFTFARADVMGRFSISDNDKCLGFLCVFDITGGVNWQSATIELMGVKFPIQKLAPKSVSSANELVSHVSESQAEARSFLKSQGIKLDKLSTSAIVAAPLDPDVAKIKALVSTIDLSKADFVEEIKNSVLKDVQKVWKQKVSGFSSAELAVFGEPSATPVISLIIPLYGRYDFIQHQIAAFSSDPFFEQVEILYVLDDPRLKREVSLTAKGVFEIFQLPFKVVFSNENRGFAGANNLGVEFASAEKLLLLNSDILPKDHDWLATLIQQFESLDNVGILGATLLYEDDTIQHKGMTFAQDSHYPGIYINHHPFKGIPNDLVTKESVFQTQLVTGACMLLNKALFQRVGGFDPLYVLGDFEDSDLCLKIIDQGFKIYCSNVELYHLERLSQDLVDSGTWKFKLTLTNGVYQDTKWRSLIEKVKHEK